MIDTLLGDLVRSGSRVELRRHVPAHRDAFIRWYQDAEIATLLRHDLRPLTPVQARGYFDSIVLPASALNTCWAIHERGSEQDAWGHGYGTEATALVAAEAFEHLGLVAVKLEVFTHNDRARNAYARVGFVETGRHTEWVARVRKQLHVIEMRLDRANFIWPGSTG
jgi:GNAT superfamily N-acetyltransferase